MKLVFQELLVRDKFFFAVDTHDEMFVDSSWADFDQWIELKRENSEIKEKIEREWERPACRRSRPSCTRSSRMRGSPRLRRATARSS